MHRGFIPLHRKTRDNWIYNDCNKLGAWCKILMEVNHKPTKKEIEGDLIDCNRGQSINSLGTWARIFGKGWTVAKVRTFFKTLQKDSMITLEGLRKTTRLNVCNYESYNNKEHRDNTEITQRQHRDNNEIATNNNVNNENNENNVNSKPLKKPTKPAPKNNFKKWSIEDFTNEIKEHGEEYESDLKNSFFSYWTEPNSTGKMRLQLERTWCTKRRLANWFNRSVKK